VSEPTRYWFVDGINVGFENRQEEGGAVDYLWKCSPGSKDTIVRPLATSDLEAPEIARAYEAFLAGSTGPKGTPLTELGLEASVVKNLEDSGVESIEALATLIDSFVMTLREGFSLKRKAQAYLEGNKITPGVQRKFDNLQAQIDELRKRLEGETK
jgi:hypothetical protein